MATEFSTKVDTGFGLDYSQSTSFIMKLYYLFMQIDDLTANLTTASSERNHLHENIAFL